MISDRRLCQLCADSYTEPLHYSDGATHFLLTKEDGHTIIAFRGSDSKLDWARNFLAFPLSGKHAGFLASATKAWARVPSEGPIVLTGHSAGGAIAKLIAAFFVGVGKAPVKVTTFGAPKVFGGIFHSAYEISWHEVAGTDYVNGGDPVPLTPAHYRRIRDLKAIGENSRIRFEDHLIAEYLTSMQSIDA